MARTVRAVRAGLGAVAMVVVGALAAGCAATPAPGATAAGEEPRAIGAVAAVDHVGDVLMAAGHATPLVSGLVRYRCSPVDAVLGIEVVADPVHLDVPWSDVLPVARVRGRQLPLPEEDPAAGAPARVDHFEVAEDGWTVRWGESNAVDVDGQPAAAVTVVGGGEVSGADLDRWAQAELVEVWHCG